ncbi:Sodium/hydrogen exchanger, partial [Agrocybe pediades]
FEVTTPHIVYAVLGGFIVLFGMFSLFLRSRLYIGEACWAFIIGVIIGPYCANIFDPRSLSHSENAEETANVITLEFTRVVLAIGVFAIGVELPKAYMRKHWKSLAFLLIPVMTWGWFVSAGLIYALVPGLNFLSSLAIAACLTPTDPILAAAVVGGKWADKHVPAHIRHLLAAESGCNDGAAFPFLYMALYLIIDKSTGAAIRDWFVLLWLYQVLLGCFVGGMLGFAFRHLMKFCQRHDLIDRHSYVAQYVSLAILTIGLTTLLGSDDLLAAFCCGTAFAWDGFFNKQTEESVFSSVIDTLFNVAAFIYVGAWMPFNQFQNAELTLSVWRLIVIAILVLLLRRLPVMVAVYKWMPDIKTFQEAVFAGHFGPIGIGAVFISTLAIEILHDAHEGGPHGTADQHRPEDDQMKLLAETIQPIVAFMVLCSIAVHGLSIPSFSLGRRVHSVSRTWSRRDSTTLTRRGGRPAQPEWANQARMVTRAEDVVVNRDR